MQSSVNNLDVKKSDNAFRDVYVTATLCEDIVQAYFEIIPITTPSQQSSVER